MTMKEKHVLFIKNAFPLLGGLAIGDGIGRGNMTGGIELTIGVFMVGFVLYLILRKK